MALSRVEGNQRRRALPPNNAFRLTNVPSAFPVPSLKPIHVKKVDYGDEIREDGVSSAIGGATRVGGTETAAAGPGHALDAALRQGASRAR